MRSVPVALQAHLNQVDTTTTRLLKVKLKSGQAYGLAMLDRNVTYDDGEYEGEIDYIATNGFDPSTISADIGYSVDNAEGYALVSDAVPGITTEMAEAGELDDATWVCYLVNYEDLSMGHVVLDAGDLGEVRTRHGMIWIPELLSYVMRLRQPIGGVWSRQCRAIFGTPAASQTGCGIDIEPLWVNGEVLVVGAESDRVFQGDSILDSSSLITPKPGRVQWLTGVNAGREYAVEEIDGDTVTLSEPTTYTIGAGDTYRIRPDCGKQYRRDCINIWQNGINFKGEPLIPVGDAASNQIPGGQQPALGAFVATSPPPPAETPEPLPSGSFEFWPNYPVMNVICVQGNSLLDPSEYSMLADKDAVVFQSFNPTPARLAARRDAILAIKAMQSDPMDTKFFMYLTPSETWKVTPNPGNNEKDINRALISDPDEGNPNWIVHRVGNAGPNGGQVEAEFDTANWNYFQVNMAILDAGLNSLNENYGQAFTRKWAALLGDFMDLLAGHFFDVWTQRPPKIYQGSGTSLITDPDYNQDGVAETAGTQAAILMWCRGWLELKRQYEARFPGKFLVENLSTYESDFIGGGGAPTLPLSNGPYYRQFELPMKEVSNFKLGLRIEQPAGTNYHTTGNGSIASFFKQYSVQERLIKSDASIAEALGRGAVWMHHSGIDRSPTSDDIEFIRFISLLCLLVERAAPCGQLSGQRVFSLDELLIEFGLPTSARSMGTLNESNLVWTTRPPDLTVGGAEFHWFVYPKAIVLVRTDPPTPGVWPSADAAVSCPLPTPPAGKKYQMPDSSTYVNPTTGRAMRGQDTTLNDGSDVTAISRKPWHAAVALIVDV